MLELLFRGFFEWIYGLILECWEYFSSVLFDLMSLDFAYLETYMPIITTIRQIMLGVGWALLLGNLVFQATRSMMAGVGFEADDPKLLFTRTFVFSFLLVASPQICDICLNMTSVIIDMVQMPDAAAIKLPNEGFFVDLTASWLLVIVFGLIVMFQTCKLFFEMAERYFILAVLTITAPLAFGVGGSRSTSDIFSGWCRMYGSMCLLMVMNVVFVKMLLSILSFRPSGIAVLPWIVMVLTVVKVAKKSDAIITRIGLNPAITGDSLGRSFPGVLTYTVARTMASRVVQTAGKNTAAGKTGAQTQAKSGSKPASGGRYYGGVNTVNTFADSRRSEQQSGSSPRQTEPRASGTEPTAQPASAATDRSFVMPGTRRPVSHVPGEQKIAPSDTISEIDEVKAKQIINLPTRQRTLLGTLLASMWRAFWLSLFAYPVHTNAVDASYRPDTTDTEDAPPAKESKTVEAVKEPFDEELSRFVNMFKLARESGYTLKLVHGTPEENAPVFDFAAEAFASQKAA